MNKIVGLLEHWHSEPLESWSKCNGDGRQTLLSDDLELANTSRSDTNPRSSSPICCHLLKSGGTRRLIYSGSLSAWPTESARVRIASYKMRRFLCWNRSKPTRRCCRMGLRYGISSGPACSSSVANALHPASWTFLLLSYTVRSNYYQIEHI